MLREGESWWTRGQLDPSGYPSPTKGSKACETSFLLFSLEKKASCPQNPFPSSDISTEFTSKQVGQIRVQKQSHIEVGILCHKGGISNQKVDGPVTGLRATGNQIYLDFDITPVAKINSELLI